MCQSFNAGLHEDFTPSKHNAGLCDGKVWGGGLNAQKNSLEILLNQPEIRLYLPLTDGKHNAGLCDGRIWDGGMHKQRLHTLNPSTP